MNHFTLFAHGENFDVDTFLAGSELTPTLVWRRGEQRRNTCVESQHPTSGVEYELGNGAKLPVHEQDSIAIQFLSDHASEVEKLVSFPGAKHCILGLQYHTEVDPGLRGWCMGPSASLMWHCLNENLELNFYVSLDRKENHHP